MTAALRLGAQVVETPAPFDSAGRVRVVTAALAQRLLLAPPAWPVAGDYDAVRLYTSSAGGGVLVAGRPAGVLERYPLTDEQLRDLRARVDAGLAATSGISPTEAPVDAIQQTRGAFVRNQMVLATILYGPLLASLSDNGETATALYLVSIGASYFALNNIKRTTIITRAQTDLATDGALRGAGTALGLIFAFGDGEPAQKAVSAATLSGAVIGAVAGYQRGIGLTSAEAHGAMSASTFAAGTALGLLGTVQDFGSIDSERLVAGTMVAAGLAGYLAGPAYPRRARYTVTAGDVRVLTVGAVLGVLTGVTPFLDEDNTRAAFAGATVGGLSGIAILERHWARKFDHSSSDVTQVWLGTIAGGLLGAAGVVLADPSVKGGMLLVTGGGVLGALAGHSFANPARAGAIGSIDGPRSGRLTFDPAALTMAAVRVPGRHAVLSLRF